MSLALSAVHIEAIRAQLTKRDRVMRYVNWNLVNHCITAWKKFNLVWRGLQ